MSASKIYQGQNFILDRKRSGVGGRECPRFVFNIEKQYKIKYLNTYVNQSISKKITNNY